MYLGAAAPQLPSRVDPAIITALELAFPTPDRRSRVKTIYGALRMRDDGIQAIPVLVTTPPLYREMAPIFGIPVLEQVRSIDLVSFYGAILYGYADAIVIGDDGAPPSRRGWDLGRSSSHSCSDDEGDDEDMSGPVDGFAVSSSRGGCIALYANGITRIGVEFARALLQPEDTRFGPLLTMVREEIHACSRQDVQRAERRGVLAPAAEDIITATPDVHPTRLGKIRPRGSSDDDDDDGDDDDNGDGALSGADTRAGGAVAMLTGAGGADDCTRSTRRPYGAPSYAARSRARLVDDIVEVARDATEGVILQLEQSVWRPLARACSRGAHPGTRGLPRRIPAQWSYLPHPPQHSPITPPPPELVTALQETFDCLVFSRAYHYPLHFGVHHAASTKTRLLQTGPHRSGLPGGDIIAFAMSVVRCAAREDRTYSEHDVPVDALSQLCLEAHARHL